MRPLQHAIPDVLTHLLRNAPLSAEKVAFAWRTTVGPAMARASAARLTGDGVIEVTCGDDHWRREIRRSLPVIRERLTALLGSEVVRQIKVPGPKKAHDSRLTAHAGPRLTGSGREPNRAASQTRARAERRKP